MITALGLGTKQAPENVNLDPQRQFWSWLAPFIHPYEKSADNYHHQRGYFHGFACTQTTPAGMSIQIGGTDSVDSALLAISGGRCVLLSTDGEPEVVTIPTAPASGSRIDTVVSYIDTTSADPEAETPGTPEYVKTIVVSGTAASSPSAPTDSQIVAALPAGANSRYYRWCDVKVAANQTTITNSNITDKKPMSPNVYIATSVIDNITATLNGLTKVAQKNAPIWYGVTSQLTRVGNVVILNFDGNANTTLEAWKAISSTEKLPAGYRPAKHISAFSWVEGAVSNLDVYPDGHMEMYTRNSGTYLKGYAVYPTDDSWPS